jgi:hypothetical protein
MDENNQKIVYFYGLLRELGHPQMDPKRYSNAENMYGLMS